jgi:malonate decarboxylase delta subunit
MEKLNYEFSAGVPAAVRALSGVVSSGDLEVLLEPKEGGSTVVQVHTAIDGYSARWQALLDRIFAAPGLPAARITIHDSGATPGVVRLRIEQAFEDAIKEARNA